MSFLNQLQFPVSNFNIKYLNDELTKFEREYIEFQTLI